MSLYINPGFPGLDFLAFRYRAVCDGQYVLAAVF